MIPRGKNFNIFSNRCNRVVVLIGRKLLKFHVRGGVLMGYKLNKIEVQKQSQIRDDLTNELISQGKDKSYYFDLVNQYCEMFAICRALIADIKERGVSISWSNSATQKGYKKNDSIAEFNKTNAQMLKILNELGLRGANLDVDSNEIGSLL